MRAGTIGRVWLLLGAVSLLGFAAAPAQAQQCSEEEDLVWELMDFLGVVLFEVDSQFDTDPSESDCRNICTKLERGCNRLGKGFVRDVQTLLKTGLAGAKVLCRTAADRGGCKSDAKEFNRELKAELKALRIEFREICADSALEDSCEDSCNEVADPPDCCEEAFGGVCPV